MRANKPKIYDVDGTAREIPVFLELDSGKYEIRFENASLIEVVDALNRLDDRFVVIASSGVKFSSSSGSPLSTSDDLKEESIPKVVSGFFSGSFFELVRDVSLTGGFSFDRIDNTFYIADNPVDLSVCSVSSVIETSLTKDDLDSLKTSFGQDVEYSLVSSKLLITGRFYAVKRYREYVLKLNEVKRSYVAKLVFVRLERSAINRLEAELKASSLDLISSGYDLLSMFEAQLDVKLSRENSYNYQEHLIYCTDGQKSALKIGSTFQREQRAVSDYGTSTTTGYQQFEDGVDVELTPKRTLNGVVELALKFENSKFTDNASLSKNQVDLNYDCLSIRENRLYYVASLTDQNASTSSRFLGLSANNDGKILTCWLVITPVNATTYKTADENIRYYK